MSFNHNRGDMIEIIIRDCSGAKIQTFKCNNQKSYIVALKIIRDKHGFNFKEKSDKDLDWLDNKRNF